MGGGSRSDTAGGGELWLVGSSFLVIFFFFLLLFCNRSSFPRSLDLDQSNDANVRAGNMIWICCAAEDPRLAGLQ